MFHSRLTAQVMLRWSTIQQIASKSLSHRSWESNTVQKIRAVSHYDWFAWLPPLGPRWLTFTWWGCCGMSLTQTDRACPLSFLFCSCVCFCLYGPLSCISFHKKFYRHLSAVSHSALPVFFLPHWPFQLCLFSRKFPSALIESSVIDWA